MDTRLSRLLCCAICCCLLFGLASGAPVINFLDIDTVGEIGIAYLNENAETPDALATVNCTVDTGSACTCILYDIDPDPQAPFDVYFRNSEYQVFFIGKTSAASALDFSASRDHYVTVSCTETTGTRQTVRADLQVRLYPNLAPAFRNPIDQTIEYDAQTELPIGTALYTVSVTDSDSDVVTFTMTQDPDNDYLSIGGTDGVIRTAVLLETVTSAQIICTVTASDGKNEAVGLVTVRLKNLNTRPEITNLPATINVTEDQTTGFTLMTLTFSDSTPHTDLGTLEPECSVDPVAESYKFTYEVGTRKLKLNTINNGETLLDFETTDKYKITCVVRDDYLSSEGDVLTLYINNVNEPPVFSQTTYHCTMPESDAGVSTCILGLTVSDPELNTIPTLEILSTGDDSQRFRYNRVTDKLTFNVDYDVDDNRMPTSVELLIYAVDSNHATGSATISVNIQDANDNTCDFGSQQAAQFTVDQGTGLQSLGSFVVTDGDLTSPNNKVEFQVVAGFPVSSLNYLTVFGTGEIKYIGLIPETDHGKSFSITVRCKDGGNPSLSSTGTVQISYLTTTTTTTSTTTTTTTTPTTVTTTTTKAPETDIWDDTTFVIVFSLLMVLLAIGIAVAVWYCCCRNNPNMCFPPRYERHHYPPRHVRPDRHDDYFRGGPSRVSPHYKDQSWRTGDHFEDGVGYNGRPTTKSDIFLIQNQRPRALPAPSGFY